MAATADLITLSKAAAELGITRQGVRLLIEKNKIKSYVISGFTFVAKKNVAKLLEERGGVGPLRKTK
jgi:hypothetical protein